MVFSTPFTMMYHSSASEAQCKASVATTTLQWTLPKSPGIYSQPDRILKTQNINVQDVLIEPPLPNTQGSAIITANQLRAGDSYRVECFGRIFIEEKSDRLEVGVRMEAQSGATPVVRVIGTTGQIEVKDTDPGDTPDGNAYSFFCDLTVRTSGPEGRIASYSKFTFQESKEEEDGGKFEGRSNSMFTTVAAGEPVEFGFVDMTRSQRITPYVTMYDSPGNVFAAERVLITKLY